MGGDQLLGEALRLWTHFVNRMEPRVVTRIALRYINQLALPLKQGDEFQRFLTAPPEMPVGAPQTLSEFLSRVVAHDDASEATVVVKQQLNAPRPGAPLVTIDVDVFRVGEFSTDPLELRRALEILRSLKNLTFFSLLTEEAVKLYA
jgi:uncharacterized protein (TIGR04255 family)